MNALSQKRIHSSIEPLEARIAPANLAFAAGIGGAKDQIVDDIATDAAGNVYVVGSFEGKADFDPSSGVYLVTATPGHHDGFVAKYTSTGQLAWVNPINSSNDDLGTLQIAVTAGGDVFVSGEFNSAHNSFVSFLVGNSGSTRDVQFNLGDSTDVFLVRLDTTGRYVWSQSFGAPGGAGVDLTSSDLAVAGTGFIYIAGTFHAESPNSTFDFGSGVTVTGQAGDTNLFVLNLDNTDSPTIPAFPIWVAQTTANGSPVGSSNVVDHPVLALDGLGGILIGAGLEGTVTFSASPSPVTLTSVSSDGLLAAKIDSGGNWQWAGAFDVSAFDNTLLAVAADAAGNAYFTGGFFGTVDFDPGTGVQNLTSPAGHSSLFLVKLAPDGTYLDSGKISGEGNSDVIGEALGVRRSDGEVFLLSDTRGTAFFDTDFTVSGTGQVLITLSGGGGFDAAMPLTKGSTDGAGLLALSPDGSVYFGTSFHGSLKVNPDGDSTTVKGKSGVDFAVARFFPDGFAARDLGAPIVQNGFTLGGAGDQTGLQIVTDGDGTVYVAGTFSGTVDFDPAPPVRFLDDGGHPRIDPNVANLTSSDPGGNIFVASYSSDGTYLWARAVQTTFTFDSSVPVLGLVLTLDGAGGVFLAGEFEGKAIFAVTESGSPIVLNNADATTGSEHRDIFLAHYDRFGVVGWAGAIAGPGDSEFVQAIAYDSTTGDVAIAGTFKNTIDLEFGSGVTSETAVHATGNGNGFIVEYSNSGVLNGVRQLGDTDSAAFVFGLAYDINGDIGATGYFNGTPDFNIGGSPDRLNGTPFNADAFIAKFSGGDGTVIWHTEIYGPRDDGGRGITADPQGNFLVTGRFTGSPLIGLMGDFQLTESGAGNGDVFLLSIGSAGDLLNAITFGGAGRDVGDAVTVDANGHIYLIGHSDSSLDLDPSPGIALVGNGFFLAEFTSTFAFVGGFSDTSLRGEIHGATVDPSGLLFVTGSYTGKGDLGGAKSSTAKGANFFASQLLPDTFVDAAHTRTFHDADGDEITVRISGPGSAEIVLQNGVSDFADLETLYLSGTTLKTDVIIELKQAGSGLGTTTIGKVLGEFSEDLGALFLPKNSTLGSGIFDTDPDLEIGGRVIALRLYDIAPNTILHLGGNLPYNIPNNKTASDTYNNRPNILIHDVLGAGVEINVIGDGTAGGVGGGGLDNILIHRWDSIGYIRTTQSIGNLNVQTGDFYAILEIDKLHNGENTTANVGTMTIEDGSWGSSGSVIEGNVVAFDADAFLAGASITAGSLGKVTVGNGGEGFAGTLTLTDDDAKGVAVFTVASDFTGSVVSLSPLKKLNIRGSFNGSLSAPSIAGITAFSFLGTQTGGVNDHSIVTTDGLLGKIKTLSGVLQNYELTTPGNFSGIDVKLGKLQGSTTGIENVHIQAAKIGNLSVKLTADKNASGVDLTGIRNSTFTALDAGNVPGSIGNISVSLGGQGGAALGLDGVTFSAATIGATKITVGHAKNSGTDVRAVQFAAYIATESIGNITLGGDATGFQASNLSVISDGKIGSIKVTSTTSEFGTLTNSMILAGQALDVAALSADSSKAAAGRLRNASLGALTVSGALTSSVIAAGGSIGKLTAAGDINTVRILAGALLGADRAIGGGDDLFQHSASIAAITSKKGAFIASTAAAGIAPGAGGFADDADAVAGFGAASGTRSSIGALKFFTGATGAYNAGNPLASVIEAASIKSLKIPGAAAIDLAAGPALIDNGASGQDTDDVFIRLR